MSAATQTIDARVLVEVIEELDAAFVAGDNGGPRALEWLLAHNIDPLAVALVAEKFTSLDGLTDEEMAELVGTPVDELAKYAFLGGFQVGVLAARLAAARSAEA